MTPADKAIGWLGLDVPVELITAGGFVPVRLTADAARPGASADAYAEGLGHPLLRALTAQIIDLGLKRVVLSSTPSWYGFLYAFLREAKRMGAGFADVDIHLFDLNRGKSHGLDSLRREAVAGLKAKVEEWSGVQVSDLALAGAIRAHNDWRLAANEMQARRERGEISGAGFLALMQSGEAAPVEAQTVRLRAALGEPGAAPVGRRVIYSGSQTPDAALYEQIEAGGVFIVGDDQDGGSRAIGPLVDAGDDLLDALARRYLARDPAPARWSLPERSRYVADLARRARAQAVLFNIAAWDHPPAWEYPALRDLLAAEGVESLIHE